jgi:CRP/FNR family cyclic AMP-dependent transcriptional regulator
VYSGEKHIERLFATQPFFAGMSAHHLELLASCATLKRFAEREVIFRIDHPANGLYLIVDGAVALEDWFGDRGTIAIETLHAGEPLGWSWLFPPYRWHYHARAIRPTAAIFFDGTTLHQLCNQDLTFGRELFKRMSEIMVRRLQASRAKLVEALNRPQ